MAFCSELHLPDLPAEASVSSKDSTISEVVSQPSTSGGASAQPSTSGGASAAVPGTAQSGTQSPVPSTSSSVRGAGGKTQTGKEKAKAVKRKGKGKGTSKKSRRTTYYPDEYCTTCEQHYIDGQGWICCDTCSSWMDRACAGLDDQYLWEHYSTEEAQFVCPMCKDT